MNKDLKKKLIASCAAAALIIPVVGGGTNSTEVKAFDLEDVAGRLVDNFFDDYDDRYDWDDDDCRKKHVHNHTCDEDYYEDRYDYDDIYDLDDYYENKYGFDFD